MRYGRLRRLRRLARLGKAVRLSKLSVAFERVRAEAARQEARYRRSEREQRARFADKRGTLYRERWVAAAASLGAEVEPLCGGYLRVRRGDAWTLARGADVMLDDHLSLEMAGDKALTARLLRDGGFDVPPHCRFALESFDRAKAFAADVGGPVVVKPASGTGAGRGVTTGVATASELLAAVRVARRYGSDLLVEPQVEGASFRLLYIGGALACAVRRDPPQVIGDGRSTIAELCRAETRRRLDADLPVAFHPLTLDLDARLFLAEQGMDAGSVPGAGQAVTVKRVANQNAAAQNHVVFADVHPTIAERGAEIVRYLGLELAGVDVMARDLSSPLDEGVVMSEVNTSPGLHHHVLVSDPIRCRPVFARTLELALERSPRRSRKELAA